MSARRAAPRRAPSSRRGSAPRDRSYAAAAARCAAPRRAPAHRAACRAPTAPPSAAQRAAQVVGVHVGARHDTAAPTRSTRRAPTPARRPARRAPSPSAGCRPAGTARCRRPRSATPGWPITPVTPSADDDPMPGVPATSLASGTVATLARNIARSCSSSARASSRATCSPAMIVIGPSARRSAYAIATGSPSCVAARSNPTPLGPTSDC